jgi:hypothetical protein
LQTLDPDIPEIRKQGMLRTKERKMSYLLKDENQLSSWIQKEVTLEETIGQGKRGLAARRIQEWLNLYGMGIDIDDAFGNITASKVKQFQIDHNLSATGVVDKQTFRELVSPMLNVLRQIPITDDEATFGEVVASYARAHLAEHPMEIGGQNCGPWVRLYMEGNQGSQWAWCAGFVKFLLKQTGETVEAGMPIAGSFSCDSLAAQGERIGHFVSETDISSGRVKIQDLIPGSIFLVRRTPEDWTHTGIVTQFNEDSFDTIEGNTNDDGHREGYEVCARMRGIRTRIL